MTKEERQQMYSDKVVPLLERKGVSAFKVADELHFSQSTFPRWKAGICVPKIDKMRVIADYFGVPLEYFYEDFGDE